ncbi:hypothetical protein KM043_001248 [Ampulex compressa]|nr:hypothetical protein KM043_001248 [Ampulex compressa]
MVRLRAVLLPGISHAIPGPRAGLPGRTHPRPILSTASVALPTSRAPSAQVKPARFKAVVGRVEGRFLGARRKPVAQGDWLWSVVRGSGSRCVFILRAQRQRVGGNAEPRTASSSDSESWVEFEPVVDGSEDFWRELACAYALSGWRFWLGAFGAWGVEPMAGRV